MPWAATLAAVDDYVRDCADLRAAVFRPADSRLRSCRTSSSTSRFVTFARDVRRLRNRRNAPASLPVTGLAYHRQPDAEPLAF